MKLAKKLASVPLEYQASVYAKETRLIRQKQEVKKRENLLKLKNQLKALKESLNPWPPLSRLAGCPHSAVKWVLN